jgi:integral membrane protein (TIGR00529 family)
MFKQVMLPLILIAIPLIAVVLLVTKHINYGLALFIGAIVIVLVSMMKPVIFLETVIEAVTDLETLELTSIVALIQILAIYMSDSGMIERLIDSIRKLLSAKAILAILPAIMGSLPMPGGALLSAPMIDDTSDKLGLNSDEKSFINVWFRHWNFFVYPLSSAIILASTLSGVSLYNLIAVQVPVLTLYVAAGYIAILRRVANPRRYALDKRSWELVRRTLVNISPIAIAVTLTIIGLNMVIALTVAIAYTIAITHMKLNEALKALRKVNVSLPLAIPGVMIFRYTLNRSGLIDAALPYLSSVYLPPVFIALAIAWIVGLATAMPSAGIALVLPIASAIIGDMPTSTASAVYISIIFSYLISPLHLCLVLTVGYYRSSIYAVYKKLIPSAIIVYLLSLIILSLMH